MARRGSIPACVSLVSRGMLLSQVQPADRGDRLRRFVGCRPTVIVVDSYGGRRATASVDDEEGCPDICARSMWFGPVGNFVAHSGLEGESPAVG
jgi:hypothetical protein